MKSTASSRTTACAPWALNSSRCAAAKPAQHCWGPDKITLPKMSRVGEQHSKVCPANSSFYFSHLHDQLADGGGAAQVVQRNAPVTA